MTEISDLVRDDGEIDARLVTRGNEDNLKTDDNVSAELCASMRQTFHDGEGTYAAVAEEHDVANGTAHHHVAGVCRHSVDVEPAEHSQARVSLKKCTEIRKDARRYGSYRAAARAHDVGATTARRHAKGNCHHDNDTRREL